MSAARQYLINVYHGVHENQSVACIQFYYYLGEDDLDVSLLDIGRELRNTFHEIAEQWRADTRKLNESTKGKKYPVESDSEYLLYLFKADLDSFPAYEEFESEGWDFAVQPVPITKVMDLTNFDRFLEDHTNDGFAQMYWTETSLAKVEVPNAETVS